MEQPMTVTTKAGDVSTNELLGDLRRLIEALDRRVPRPERGDELRIAREAAGLREHAVRLMLEMEGDSSRGR